MNEPTNSPLYTELSVEVESYSRLIFDMYSKLSTVIDDKELIAGLVYEWFQTQMQKDLLNEQARLVK